jgi:hypothetical protein
MLTLLLESSASCLEALDVRVGGGIQSLTPCLDEALRFFLEQRAQHHAVFLAARHSNFTSLDICLRVLNCGFASFNCSFTCLDFVQPLLQGRRTVRQCITQGHELGMRLSQQCWRDRCLHGIWDGAHGLASYSRRGAAPGGKCICAPGAR